LSTHQNFQLNNKAVFSGRAGLKRDTSKFEQKNTVDFSLLVDGRIGIDVGKRLSLEAVAGALSTGGTSEVRYSFGTGVNYTLNRNLRLNVAYNIVGFKEEDLDAEKYNVEGGRIGLQYNLDEDLFKWLL